MTEQPVRRGRRRGGGGGSPAAAPLRMAGGRLDPLGADAVAAIDAAARDILATVGMGDAPSAVVTLVRDAGGTLDGDGRLLLPPALVDAALAGLRRDVVLAARAPGLDMVLSGKAVHLGSGGAAPVVVDLETGLYRPSTLADLYDAARLVDRLPHVQFFSRSLVARDVEDPRQMDLNTAYASLAGTTKHVMTSAASVEAVADIAELCAVIAGGADAFRARPFLSLNINHVVPPLRFAPEAAEVLIAAARAGLPVQVNTFGQLGASSPVTIAGCVAQTVAETLAGMIVAWLANPEVMAVFGPRPMVTDLRTGAMAGGSGEQALLTSVAVRMAQHYGLPNSTIAGATDSKLPDAQAGFEKCLNVTMAAQTGANLITQAAGMLAGLMAASFEAYVIDNDMLGAVLRSLAPVEVGAATLSPEGIGAVVRGEGHFLGHADTFARMQSDFLYPDLADRRTPDAWAAAGAPDIRQPARDRARAILASHFPAHLPPELDAALRARFDIHLPETRMRPA